jgi:general nucleoside transport system ATP-binding protein
MPDISLRAISKVFHNTRAVDDVTIDFHAGEIHALLGENGAGKSTLMHILCGLYKPDAGQILIDGEPCCFSSPRAALTAGIAMVHQHFMLISTLSITENVFLATTGNKLQLARPHSLAQQVRNLAARHNIAIGNPNTRVATLSVGEQQRVEILKALAAETQVLILDEPTAVLTPTEVEDLFSTLQRLKYHGYTILLITHKIREVLAVSDRLSVLRRGRLVATRDTATCTANELIHMMVGAAPDPLSLPSATNTISSKTAKAPRIPLLAVQNLSLAAENTRPSLRNISFCLAPGEILGVAGVEGNGQTALVDCLTGCRSPDHGTIWLGTQDMSMCMTPAQMRSAGVAFIPQDRRREGLATELTIAENLLLNTHRLTTAIAGPLLTRATITHLAHQQIIRFAIHPPIPTSPVSTLSGGNQQRIVIARELASNPQLILAINPTRGLDVGATRYVQQTLIDHCCRGAGVLLISSDLDEIFALSTHIYTLYQGQLQGPVQPTVGGREQIGRMMAGAEPPC